MKAIILAAGLGTRLRPITDRVPKCMVPVNGKPIIDKQIENLLNNGIQDIIVVSGYKSDILEEHLSKYDNVTIVNNDRYDETNNMYSLYLALQYIGNVDFLLMNSDVYFDENIIEGLISSKIPNQIACELDNYMEESMKVTLKNNYISHISKAINEEEYYAVSIDVYKISNTAGAILLQEIIQTIEIDKNENAWTEVALDSIFSKVEFSPYVISGRWFEIDNHVDLKKAEKLFAVNKQNLCDIDLFLLDMDGTIYIENELIEGAMDFFDILIKNNKKYVFMTNNSSKNKHSYVQKLASLGVLANEDNIASSINATIMYLNKIKPKAKLYLVGTESFKLELESEGFVVVPDDYRGSDVDFVLLGFDTELNYQKIIGACFFVSRGYKFIATNCDVKCPVADGKFIPDCGAIAAMIESATNVKPTFLGKPSPKIVNAVSDKFNVPLNKILCVGDRLYTDIQVGINAGTETAVVLTGEATLEDISTSNIKPTYTYNSIKDLYEQLKKEYNNVL